MLHISVDHNDECFTYLMTIMISVGDMGNGGPQANSVFYEANGYSSYRDERWRVGKPMANRIQI